MKMLIMTLFACCVLLAACRGKSDTFSSPEIPVSLASTSEQQIIDRTLAEIQKVADRLGLNQSFKTFPVVVVEKAPMGDGEIWGFCQQNSDGKGVYIGIIKSALQSIGADDSTMFLLLVHEFGHCLYQRDHDETTINVPGFNIYIQKSFDSIEYVLLSGQISVSAMAVQRMSLMGMFLPDGLRDYSVAEIAGLKRWKNRDDLDATQGLKLLPL